MSDLVQVERQGHVSVLTLNRASKKNALNLEMYEALTGALEAASADAGVRAVLLQASGPSFTAGNDLADFLANPPISADSPVFRFLLALVDFDKPLVVAVRGHAVGVGTTLMLHADLIYVAPDAKLKLPFTQLALVPEAGSSWLLPRMAGHARAAELLLLGEGFDAQTALELGLVTAIVPTEALDQHAMAKAQALCALPPSSVRATKRLIKDPVRPFLKQVMAAEAEVFAAQLQSAEFKEAVTAFFEKRLPDFSKMS